jgi:hypothetical protein
VTKILDEYEQLWGDALAGILPCPWCGEEYDEGISLEKHKNKHGWYHISCGGCGAGPSGAVYTWEEAIAFWNNRASFSSRNEYLLGVAAARRQLQDYLSYLQLDDGHIEPIPE